MSLISSLIYFTYPKTKGVFIMSETAKNWESSLKEGERLKWQGRPTMTGIIDPSNKYIIYAEFGIGIIWMLCSFIFYLPKRADLISMIIINLVPVFLILMPILNAKSIRNTYYAITDKRVIISLDNQEYSLDYDENTEIKRKPNGTILVGATVNAKTSKERHLLLFRGVMDTDKNVLGVVIYTPDDPDGAYKALTEKQELDEDNKVA